MLFAFCLASSVSYGSDGAPIENPVGDTEFVVGSADNATVADQAGVLFHDVVFDMTPEFRIVNINASAESFYEEPVIDVENPPLITDESFSLTLANRDSQGVLKPCGCT